VKAGRCFGQAVAVLAVFAAARPFGLLGPAVLSVSILTAVLALIAWSAGATPADPGLGRSDVRTGLVFCWLRLRSRSLIAPVMAHVATNGLALTVAWFAVH